MTGPMRRFDSAELREPGEPAPSQAEQADLLIAGRELEAAATATEAIRPTEGFEDRVMAAIALEPSPRVVIRPGSAVRGGRPAALLLAIRDAWGIATTGGRPWAVRGQALAFLLLVVIAAGTLTTAAGVSVGALLGPNQSPAPSVQPGPTIGPTPTATPSPTIAPTPTAEPTETPEATETPEPTETPEHGGTRTPRATDDHGG